MQIKHGGGDSSGSSEISRIVRSAQRGRDVIVRGGNTAVDPETLLEYVIACSDSDTEVVRTLLIVPAADSVQAIESVAGTAGPAGKSVSVAHLGPAEDARSEAHSVMSGPDVVVTTPHRLIDHIRRGNIDLSGVTTCLVLPPDDDTRSQFSADLHFIYTKFDQQPATVLFGEAEDDGSLATLMRRPLTVSLPDSSRGRRPEPEEEQTTMSENEFPFDPKATARQLRDIIKRIHEDEDPAVMNQYRRFIRRNVSIFHRGYFTAYLFRQFASEGGVTATARKSVFVSAGRNRRVHARDLLTLFTSTDGVDRDDIGQIKVLDNYSFVEVEASKAQQAIDSLNGTEFRGRSLTVNFARKK